MINYYNFIETLLGRFIHNLSLKRQQALGQFLIHLATTLKTPYFRRMLRALHKTFPDKSRHEIFDLAAKAYQKIVRNFIRLGYYMYQPKEVIERDIAQRIRIDSLDEAKSVYAKGKGMLIISCHLGFFYHLLSFKMPELENNRVTIIRPKMSRGRQALLEKLTEITGKNIDFLFVHDNATVLEFFRRLRDKEVVCCMLDYAYEDTHLVRVPFLGSPAKTPGTIAALAIKSKSPVIPLFTFEEDGKIVVRFEKEIPIADTGNLEKDIHTNMLRFNRVLERYILKYPDQWDFWESLIWRWR